MKVKAVSVQVVELITEEGRPLGLFAVSDEWQGMHKLVPIAGEPKFDAHPSMIVDHGPDVDAKVFGPRYGEHRAVLDVVKASPDLLSSIMGKST